MAKVFILGGKYQGKTVRLMNRYVFIDGIMLEEDDKSAEMKAKVLTGFYPVEVVDHAEYAKRMAAPQTTGQSVDDRPAFRKAEAPA